MSFRTQRLPSNGSFEARRFTRLRFRFRPILADALSYGISASDIIAVVESELEKMPSQKSAGKSKSKPNQNKTETDQEFSQ